MSVAARGFIACVAASLIFQLNLATTEVDLASHGFLEVQPKTSVGASATDRHLLGTSQHDAKARAESVSGEPAESVPVESPPANTDSFSNLPEYFGYSDGSWHNMGPWMGLGPWGIAPGSYWQYPYPWAPGWPPHPTAASFAGIPRPSESPRSLIRPTTTEPPAVAPAAATGFSTNELNALLLQLISILATLQARQRSLTDSPFRDAQQTGLSAGVPLNDESGGLPLGDGGELDRFEAMLADLLNGADVTNNDHLFPEALLSGAQTLPIPNPIGLAQVVADLAAGSQIPWWAQMLGLMGEAKWSAIDDFQRTGNDPWPFAKIFGSPFTRSVQAMNAGNPVMPMPLARLLGNAPPPQAANRPVPPVLASTGAV